ncbi:hypothetical protein ACIOHS_32090 [Streptomyces sp. NPDC088253]|uniref:hypothetical protein n=1 Tax=Streptomyces sp. NPDC088253 TaxID=3365846 RepID=UPI0037F6ADFC
MSYNAEHAPRETGIGADRPDHPPGAELVPQGERDRLTLRLQQELRLALKQYREIAERLLKMSAPIGQ